MGIICRPGKLECFFKIFEANHGQIWFWKMKILTLRAYRWWLMPILHLALKMLLILSVMWIFCGYFVDIFFHFNVSFSKTHYIQILSWLEGESQNLRLINHNYHPFKPFFQHCHMYLSQNWDSDSHFEMLSRSVPYLLL